jgi:hypothetical protein
MHSVFGRPPNGWRFACGWIDQPFVSRLNPAPPGSTVVVSLEPDQWFTERSGMPEALGCGTGRVRRAD